MKLSNFPLSKYLKLRYDMDEMFSKDTDGNVVNGLYMNEVETLLNVVKKYYELEIQDEGVDLKGLVSGGTKPTGE